MASDQGRLQRYSIGEASIIKRNQANGVLHIEGLCRGIGLHAICSIMSSCWEGDTRLWVQDDRLPVSAICDRLDSLTRRPVEATEMADMLIRKGRHEESDGVQDGEADEAKHMSRSDSGFDIEQNHDTNLDENERPHRTPLPGSLPNQEAANGRDVENVDWSGWAEFEDGQENAKETLPRERHVEDDAFDQETNVVTGPVPASAMLTPATKTNNINDKYADDRKIHQYLSRPIP